MAHRLLDPAREPDEPILGTWVTANVELALELYARTDIEFVAIDCQHSLLTEADALAALRRLPGDLPFATLARSSRNEPTQIGRLADAGADGIIVPMIESADEARAAVAATSFPPRGIRSLGPLRPGMGWDTDELAARVRVFPMIETAAALADVEAICATPEIGGVYVGPADLSIALGLSAAEAFATDQLDEPLKRIADACSRAGVLAGIHAMGAEDARHFMTLGFRMFTLGTDSLHFVAGVQAALAAMSAPTEPLRRARSGGSAG